MITELRKIANAWRLAHSLPIIDVHASVLAFALIHPVTGDVVAYINSAGALVTPNGTFSDAQIVTTSTPTTGGTVTFGTAKTDELLNLTPAGTLATLTATFPTNTNSRIGQRIAITSSQIITALTISAAGLTIQGITPGTLAANQTISFVKVAASTWKRTDGLASVSGQILTGPIITTGLTASGSTSNDFSGSTGTFKTSTGRTTVGGPLSLNTVNTAVAAAGSTNSDAAALTSASVQHVSSDSAAKGVKLPVGVPGDVIKIINDSATACKLYPEASGNVNGATTTSGSVTIPASKGVEAHCTVALTWIVFDLPAKSA